MGSNAQVRRRTNATACCASCVLHEQPEWAPFASTARLVVVQPRFSFSSVMYLLQSPVSSLHPCDSLVSLYTAVDSEPLRCQTVNGAAACTRWLGSRGSKQTSVRISPVVFHRRVAWRILVGMDAGCVRPLAGRVNLGVVLRWCAI